VCQASGYQRDDCEQSRQLSEMEPLEQGEVILRSEQKDKRKREKRPIRDAIVIGVPRCDVALRN
jgi:hypothetical protein